MILMIASYFSRSLGMLFFIACFGALMNPPPYILIGVIFLVMGLVLLPSTNKLIQGKFNYQIKGGSKTIVILVGFLLIYLIVPQVQLETTSFSNKYIDRSDSESELRQI